MFVRIYLICGEVRCIIKHALRPNYIIPGNKITKTTRQELLGVVSVAAKQSMTCEKFQRKSVEDGTGFKCLKSGGMRINTATHELSENTRPYSGPNASYDWTEDFDGLQTFGGKCQVFYNFKSIVEDGGAQTRSLKCVYEFVKAQQNLIRYGNVDKNIFFVNILDGEVCTRNMDKFSCFDDEDHIYVGDSYSYFEWLNSKLEIIL
jgi:hypothetical protein